MSAHVLLIHGVGSFDKEKTEARLTGTLQDFGFHVASFSAFDWCAFVGDPFENLPRLGRSALRMAHVNSHPKTLDPLRSVFAHAADFTFLLVQLGSLALFPVMVFCWMLKSFRPGLAWSSALILLLSGAWVSEALTGGRLILRRCLRRTIFCFTWPVVHTLATAAYLRLWRACLILAGLCICEGCEHRFLPSKASA